MHNHICGGWWLRYTKGVMVDIGNNVNNRNMNWKNTEL